MGEEYLPGVQLSKLEETYRRECPGKSRDRLQVAVFRKRGCVLKEIGCTIGRGISTVYRWLYRMECDDPKSRYNTKSSGRPRLLSPEQERTIIKWGPERYIVYFWFQSNGLAAAHLVPEGDAGAPESLRERRVCRGGTN